MIIPKPLYELMITHVTIILEITVLVVQPTVTIHAIFIFSYFVHFHFQCVQELLRSSAVSRRPVHFFIYIFS